METHKLNRKIVLLIIKNDLIDFNAQAITLDQNFLTQKDKFLEKKNKKKGRPRKN